MNGLGQNSAAAPVQLDLEERLARLVAPAAAEPAAPLVYAVSELVKLAARQIETSFANIWVEGEVSNLRTPSSGHAYFTLKDAQSQLAAVMFRSAVGQLKFRLEDGQLLRCRGRLTIYEAQGRFQLMADQAEPVGAGALQLAFEQLKRKLGAEGLFEARHKKALPLLPRKIAVVTSSTGAALHDILRVLKRRCPVHVVLCPTAVQGAEAPAEIVAALARADGLGADVVIVGRGGGSLEDLAAFNHEQVARAIFALRTPVISAVGHEVDVTIADLVADCRAPTPSAAAELAVPVLTELQQQLDTWVVRLARATKQHEQRQRLRLERLIRRMGTPQGLVDRRRMVLDEFLGRMQQLVYAVLSNRRAHLVQCQRRLDGQHPQTRLLRQRARVEQLEARLSQQIQLRLERSKAGLAAQVAALQALSPLQILARGYSLVLDPRGQPLRDAQRVAVGDSVRVRLQQGALACRVEAVEGCSNAARNELRLDDR